MEEFHNRVTAIHPPETKTAKTPFVRFRNCSQDK